MTSSLTSSACPSLRRNAGVVLLALLFRAGLAAEPAQQGGLSEYQVKAAFLFQFTRYVEWPADTFPNPAAPFRMCIVGIDPFGGVLDDLVSGERVGDHDILIARLKEREGLRSCHLVFVPDSEAANAGRILARLQGAPILSVGESPRFAQQGGIIGFYFEGKNARFEI